MNHAEQPASSPARPRGFVYEDAPEEGGTMATRRSSHDRTHDVALFLDGWRARWVPRCHHLSQAEHEACAKEFKRVLRRPGGPDLVLAWLIKLLPHPGPGRPHGAEGALMRMLRKAQCEGQLAARPTPADIADYLERAHAEAHPTLDAVERTDRRGRPLWYRGRADVRITWTTDTNMSKTSRTWVSRLYAALRYPRPSGRTRVSRRSGSAR